MEITTHAPGTFCWIELGTTDVDAARAFYTGLFGWTAEDVPASEGTYTLFKLGDHDVGGLYPMSAAQHEQDLPPHWLNYVAVEDADATVERARAAGGTVLVEPSSTPGIGRMAVVQDPLGAPFAVWQAGGHPGAGVLGVTGAVCWTELAARDADAAAAFYADVIGWEAEAKEVAAGPYTFFKRDDEHQVGGMMQMTEEWGDTPSHWMLYIAVDDCDAAAARAEELGGTVCVPPTGIPEIGRFAVIDDPQGASFSIIQLEQAD